MQERRRFGLPASGDASTAIEKRFKEQTAVPGSEAALRGGGDNARLPGAPAEDLDDIEPDPAPVAARGTAPKRVSPATGFADPTNDSPA